MLPYRDSRVIRIALSLFFLLLIAYGIYEAQGIFFGPMIEVPESTLVVSEAYTTIQGKAERITELRLNGKQINVTENGDFEEPYLLAEGSNHLILEARDARGRRTQKTIDIVYNPPSPPQTTSATSS